MKRIILFLIGYVWTVLILWAVSNIKEIQVLRELQVLRERVERLERK